MSHSDLCKHGHAVWCHYCDGGHPEPPDLMKALEESLKPIEPRFTNYGPFDRCPSCDQGMKWCECDG